MPNVRDILNTMYPRGLADATYRESKKNAFLLLVNKDPEAHGKSFDVLVQHTLGGGGSADYNKARTNNNGTGQYRFNLPYANMYEFARIDAKEWAASLNGGGVVNVMTNALAAAQKRMRLKLAQASVGDGSGAQARIKEIAPTTPAGSFRVTDPRDSRMFSVGTVLQSNPNKAGSIGTIRAGTAIITKVVRDISASGGLVYFTATGGWTPVVNDYLYIDGDYGQKMAGVESWIPASEPSQGENFFGVDRSVDSVALAGIRQDGSGETSHEQAIIKGMEAFSVFQADTSHVFVSPYDYTRLASELAAKKRIVDVPTEYEIGLEAIQLAGGQLVLEDTNIRKGYAWVLDMSTWCLRSIGAAPHIKDEDKLKLRSVDDADAFEAVFRSWVNLECKDPSQNGNIKLPA